MSERILLAGGISAGRLVLERAIGGAFEIVELAGAERPHEGAQTNSTQQQCNRHKPGESGHVRGFPARRSAFAVTRIDELDMTIAAISGVTKPAMASGTQTML